MPLSFAIGGLSMVKVLINCVFTVCAIAAYDHFKVDEVGQPVAVANYDAVYMAHGTSADSKTVGAAMDGLQKDAAKLAAAGFVVIDSRALLGYPASTEIPVTSSPEQPVANPGASPEEVENKGTAIDEGAFDEK